jgi:fermentation-respiration switch protein FrsA (DUF1100 family)
MMMLRRVTAVLLIVLYGVTTRADERHVRESLVLRGRPQLLHLYGSRGGTPVIVSSGDGGWVHLGPHVAEVLSTGGYFAAGFDVKAYLQSFTGQATLRPADVAADYTRLVDFASKGATGRPVLIGVSEGAGLSVLAATDPQLKSSLGGVIALGLPEQNELAWRWTDSIIYLTHRPPREPSFSASAIIDRVAPVPLAAIHSTHDEFVSVDQVRQIFNRAAEPKHLWVIDAANHRFSDNLPEFDRRLLDAMAWITTHEAR